MKLGHDLYQSAGLDNAYLEKNARWLLDQTLDRVMKNSIGIKKHFM